MYLDQRGHYIERVRYALQAAAYPIQLAVSSPPTAWRWLKESSRRARRSSPTTSACAPSARDLELRSMR